MEWLLVAGAVVAGATLARGYQRRAEQRRHDAADLALLRRTIDEDVIALGEDLQQLDVDLGGEELDDGSRLDFKRGLDAYDRAKDAADGMRRADDARQVSEKLDDGRFAIACVQARVAGLPRPERRPPCFFDPRHGQSATDVRWAPSGGAMREVPACVLDAERVRGGVRPNARKVLVGTRLVPYWRGGTAFRPLAAGYFGTDPAEVYFAGTAIASAVVLAGGLGGHGYGGEFTGGGGYGGGDFGGDLGGGSDFGGGS